jgi:hypothetical protein
MLTRRNDAGDGVLRPARLSIANGLASRLHQAIIPNSELRESLPLYPLPAFAQRFFIFRLQKVFYRSIPSPAKNMEKAKANGLFINTATPFLV